jgi:hypothetical protein
VWSLRRNFPGRAAVPPDAFSSRNAQPIRVCDEAAQTLSSIRRDLAFDTTRSYAELDCRIEELKKKLRADKHRKAK